jgi:hypothetical protein
MASFSGHSAACSWRACASPRYIPASIVLGRCHVRVTRTRGARLLHVLALDGENVKRSRHSRTTCSSSRMPSAGCRPCSLDRSNDEARNALTGGNLAPPGGSRLSAKPDSREESVLGKSATPAGQESAAGGGCGRAEARLQPPVAEPAVGWVCNRARSATPPSRVDDLEASAVDFTGESPPVSSSSRRRITVRRRWG